MVLLQSSLIYHRSAHKLLLFYFHIFHCYLPLCFSLIISFFLWSWLSILCLRQFPKRWPSMGGTGVVDTLREHKDRYSPLSIMAFGFRPTGNKNPRKHPMFLVCTGFHGFAAHTASTWHEIKLSRSLNSHLKLSMTVGLLCILWLLFSRQ